MYPALEQATGGGASQPAESTADVYRIALDGQAYSWSQYVEHYGNDAQRRWDEAAEFFDGNDASQLAVNAYAEPQRTAGNDEATSHEHAIQHQHNDSEASQVIKIRTCDQAVQVESGCWFWDPRPSFEDFELKATAPGSPCRHCGVELEISSWGVCTDCILDCKLEEPATYQKWLKKIRSSS